MNLGILSDSSFFTRGLIISAMIVAATNMKITWMRAEAVNHAKSARTGRPTIWTHLGMLMFSCPRVGLRFSAPAEFRFSFLFSGTPPSLYITDRA